MQDNNQQPGNNAPGGPGATGPDPMVNLFLFFRWLVVTESGRAIIAFFVVFSLIAGLLGAIFGDGRGASGQHRPAVHESRPVPEPAMLTGNGIQNGYQIHRQDAPIMQIPQGATGGCITVNNMTECHWTRGR